MSFAYKYAWALLCTRESRQRPREADDFERGAVNMIARISLLVLVALSMSFSAHAQSEAPIQDDVTVLSTAAANRKVEITLTSAIQNSIDVFPDAGPGQFPERFRVVRSLSIKVNGREIFVPHSAFADLVWVAHAELKVAKPISLLTISGGDASESYSAKIEFDQKAVRSRKVYSGEDPGAPTEQTRYFLRVLN
jgi:hypothetical protein